MGKTRVVLALLLALSIACGIPKHNFSPIGVEVAKQSSGHDKLLLQELSESQQGTSIAQQLLLHCTATLCDLENHNLENRVVWLRSPQLCNVVAMCTIVWCTCDLSNCLLLLRSEESFVLTNAFENRTETAILEIP